MVDPMGTRVFLLDDHGVVRVGLATMIDSEPDLEVVGQAGNAENALTGIAESQPDVAVLDVRLDDGNGIEVCREIHATHPDVRCIMLTSFADDRALVDAGAAGASAYVLKQVRGDELADTIRAVAGGRQLLDPATLRHATERLRASGELLIEDLSPQEKRLFVLIGDGYSNRQIADELYLAEKTVKNYVSTLLAKLGMTRRTEVAALAARLDERQNARDT
jgi:two-component system response regulator DevR